MGAMTFFTVESGRDAQEAFHRATLYAQHRWGHEGYTGTIAEKDEFIIIKGDATPAKETEAIADKMLKEGDERINDKWGPAGAIKIEDAAESNFFHELWAFFGWASS